MLIYIMFFVDSATLIQYKQGRLEKSVDAARPAL
jgi:hypothetical protein